MAECCFFEGFLVNFWVFREYFIKNLFVKSQCKAILHSCVTRTSFQLLEDYFILADVLALNETSLRILINDFSGKDKKYILTLLTFCKDGLSCIESHRVQLIEIVQVKCVWPVLQEFNFLYCLFIQKFQK